IQEKDTVILKLKEKIKSSSGDVKEIKVERKVEEIETLNLELDHKVTKLAAENENLKQTYKQLFDSIKSSRVQSKVQCDDLINKVNLKSVEVADLNTSLQEKVLVIAALKEQLKVPKLRKNKTAHIDYITDLGTNLVAVTPKNQTKQIRRVALVSSASRSKSQDN
nr:pyruvate, phosphate dikinase regulatory protein, chloroplastic [Tanacetum cinerariifolium]